MASPSWSARGFRTAAIRTVCSTSRASPLDYRFNVRWTDDGPEGWIATDEWRLDLNDVSGVYARLLGTDDRAALPGLDPADATVLRTEADLGLMALLEDIACPVVNRIGGGLSNNSKPYQAIVIRRAGLGVPPTLVTSDPDAVRAFHAEHGEVIYKSASGVRSIVRRVGAEQLARLDRLRDGPAQFQAFVPGRNVRVHTVGTPSSPPRSSLTQWTTVTPISTA